MKRFLLDTDTAGDDAFAILLLALTAGARLEAVTTVAGNLPVDRVTENALYTLQQAGRLEEVPVYRGADRPLLRPLVTAESVHGADGMGDSNFPPARGRPQAEHAVDALVRLIHRHAGDIELVAIGPLTNVALAYMKAPSIAREVRRLWVMGGCNNGLGNVTPAAEYNFYADPEAARMVVRAGFPLTLVSWDLCVRYATFEPAVLAEIEAMETPLSHFFTAVNRRALEFSLQGGYGGSVHPDSLTVAMALDPGIIRRQAACFVDVECAGELTRGYSLVDVRGVLGRPPNVDVVLEADPDRFRRMMLTLLRSGRAGAGSHVA